MTDPTPADHGRRHILSALEFDLAARARELKRAIKAAEGNTQARPDQRQDYVAYLNAQGAVLRGMGALLRQRMGKPIEPDAWWEMVREGRE